MEAARAHLGQWLRTRTHTRRGVIAAFMASQRRTKKVQFKDGRYTRGFQEFNRRLVERGATTWYFNPDMRVVNNSIVARSWLVTANLIVRVHYQSDEVQDIHEDIHVVVSGTRQTAQEATNRAVQEFIHHLQTRPSPVKAVISHRLTNLAITEQTGFQPLVGNGGAALLSGYADGRDFMPEGVEYGCAYHAINHRYGKVKGWIKSAKPHVVFNLFNGTRFKSWEEVVRNEPLTHERKLAYYGVTPDNLVRWGKETNTSVYIIDEADGKLGYNIAVDPRLHRPLGMLLKDGHWYLLQDTEKLKSLGQRFSPHAKLHAAAKKAKEAAEATEDNVCELPEDGAWDALCRIVVESGVLPDQKSIRLTGDGKLVGMKIADTYYRVSTHSYRLGKRFAEHNKTEWNGDSLNQIIGTMVREELSSYQSRPPPSTTALLNAKKDFAHYGPTPHHAAMLRSDPRLDSDWATTYDIRAQDYTSMVMPAEPWYVMDFNSVPTPIPDGDLPFGFYYIKTSDMKMAIGSGLYCRAFTLKMLHERLCTRDQLLYYIPAKSMEHTAVLRLFNRIDAMTEGDRKLQKIARNLVAGTLGISKTSRGYGRIARFENGQEAMNYFLQVQSQKPIFKPNSDQTHVLYGDLRQYDRTAHYLPMYLQQMQFGLMRLYQHLKPYWKQVCYRKRDAFIVLGDHKCPALGDDIGMLKIEETPVLVRNVEGGELPSAPDVPELTPKWTHHRGLTSDDAVDVLTLLEEHGGCEVSARAGYGKSYLARRVVELATEKGWRVACAAFTNLAANNLKGVTIHKLFGMSVTDSEPANNIAAVLSKKYDLIVFDEMSMIPGVCWFAISQLKTRVLLVGDWRQLSPVNDVKYQYHPEINRISRGQRVVLKRGSNVRYDEELEQASDNVMTYVPVRDKVITDRNICWSNACVVRVNLQVLNTKPGARYAVPLPPDSWKDITSGDKGAWKGRQWYVLAGQPLITCKPLCGKIFKNEMLVARDVADGVIHFDDDVSVELKDFWECLRPGYAATTHKSQGATITEDYSVWEWDRMDKELRYTAMTRATRLSQIHFH